MDRAEAARRASNRERIERYLLAHPGEWVPAAVLAELGGWLAFRTRISDVRIKLQTAGRGDIEWNKQSRASAYRFVPQPGLWDAAWGDQ